MKCEHCETELKRMPFVLHVDQECSVNSGEDYLVDLCSFPCLRAWAIEHKPPPPPPPPEYKPGDRVELKADLRHHSPDFRKAMPDDLIVTLEADRDSGDCYLRANGRRINERDIKCLAPEPPEPKTRKFTIELSEGVGEHDFRNYATCLQWNGYIHAGKAMANAKELPDE